VHPFYRRVLKGVGGRQSLASGLTVLLCLLVLIIPLLLFFGILVGEAVKVAESAGEWVTWHTQHSDGLKERIEANRYLKQLLPYQSEILGKLGEMASKAGSLVADGLAAGAKSTAEFLLLLFIMLYAMFNFLVDGRTILDTVLRFTPLSDDEKVLLLQTFTSVGRATLKGTLVIGIVQGALGGLAFWAAGIGGALFWAVVMAVASVVPSVGTALVWVPAVGYLILNGQAAAAVGVGLWCAIVVGTIDNLLRPLLVGKDTEMPDLLVMLTTLGGLALFGPVGILTGPIVGALYMTLWRLWGRAVDANGADSAVAAGREAEE
jgi:predicted PurR-regulated permease PerM